MATARKKKSNGLSMAAQWRKDAYAAIQINWKKMRPDLAFDKEASREERLAWIAEYLGLKQVGSLTELTDQQLGMVAGEMKWLTGHKSDRQPADATPRPDGAEIYHLASKEQVFALQQLEEHIGWTTEQRENYLAKRFGGRKSFQMLAFEQALSATIQLLNIAAHKDLKAQGMATVSRKDTAKYIPFLKQKLGIDKKETR